MRQHDEKEATINIKDKTEDFVNRKKSMISSSILSSLIYH